MALSMGPGPLQSADGIVVDHFQVDLVPHQLPNVGNAILNHGGSMGRGGVRQLMLVACTVVGSSAVY